MKTEYAVQIIWSPEDNAYLAIPAELIGCVADGRTPEEALANVRVVIDEWIEVAKEDGREIPKPMTLQDAAQLQERAQANLRNHIEAEVKKAVSAVLQQLVQSQQPMQAWGYRGGLVVDPAENLVPSGGR
jgi:predicted RNase H-like HicB family nuclease